MKLIDKDALVAEIEKCINRCNEKKRSCPVNTQVEAICDNKINAYNEIVSCLNALEVKEVDLEKLGEIARHLIAVKERIEDMRLDKDEWSMLEKIGYPERFKAQKGE